MKKLFLKISMLLFVLAIATGTAWAYNLTGMTDEEAVDNAYWVRLTAKPATATNGSGKVCVISTDHYTSDPADGDYLNESHDDGWSDIFITSSIVHADVEFRNFAKADDGSYFTGWSFTDGYTDLGNEGNNFRIELTPSATKGQANIRQYTIYAAFQPVQLVSYEKISGSQEVADDGNGNWTCTQQFKFRAETPGFEALAAAADIRHFKRPVVTAKAGTTGTWTIGDAEWISSENVYFYNNYAELIVPVTFTAPNGDAGEYAATLTLETYAGVKMTVYVYARKTVVGAQAVRYNKSKVQQEAGNLTSLLANAAADDIIKLNDDYSSAVEINKNITFDLNGYTLSNTLTVSGGNVTLAYSPFGGTISDNVSVTGGKLTLAGGTISSNVNVSAGAALEQNGAAITGNVTNAGAMTTTDGSIAGQLASSGALTLNGGTFTNESGAAISITGGTADIKRGTISGSTYGVQTTGGSAVIGKLAAVTGTTKALYGNGGSLTVNNGKFSDPANLIAGSVTFNAGYFKTNSAGGTTALGKQVWRNTAGAEFRDGYVYFVGNQDAAQASNVSVCRIGYASYSSLEEALAYANNNPNDGVIILMENDYVLPAGYYTLPSNATLIVPMSNEQEGGNQIVPHSAGAAPNPISFRKLTFASGVNMEVAGTIELSCTQYGSGEKMGVPGGNYGHLILKPGSHMTINNGGKLRAWGFVTGDGTKDAEDNYLSGEIDVRRGGTVHEMFQMGDWKGGDLSFTIAMDPMIPEQPCWRDLTHLFPVYMYFIQNVESPVKYHPGASLICAASVNVSSGINAYANDIKVVGKEGEAAMFLMDEMADAENTWVRKYYDAKKDQQVYEVNSGAQLGSMVIDLGTVPAGVISPGASGSLKLELDSRKFVLPLTSNFKIHLLSGYMEFTQSTSCLPGMEVEVDKESEVAIVKNSDPSIVSGALYLYDADQWSFQNNQTYGYVGNTGKFGAIVNYSATWDLGTNGATKKPNVRDISSPADIGDAILNVHGTFRMGANCAVYTTWSQDISTFQIDEDGTGGASIISTNEDAGTFIFDAAAPAPQGLIFDTDEESGEPVLAGFGQDVLVNYDHNDYSDYGIDEYPIQIMTVMEWSENHESANYTRAFGWELCTPAKLKNGAGAEEPFTETSGTLAGTSYCFRDNHWTTMQVAEDPCFMKEIIGGQTIYYAKPSEYVAVAATWDGVKMVGNADHTYSDKAGAGRLFILMVGDCQWWEVEKKDNLYHCIHPNNDTYYYWDGSQWAEQRFTITWKNWDGTEIKSYTYDATTGEPEEVEYSVTYGTQAVYLGSNPTRNADEDYTYSFTGWSPALDKVTSDVTYTATYEKQQRKYTIIFTEEGGAEIERQFLIHNAMPACENTPTRTGFTLQWEPELAAVTGDATYRATWLENPPTEYAVTFFDYDGTTKLKPTDETPYMVAVGTMPIAPANPSGKPATNEFTYEFDHWSPELEAVSATSAKSYTAVYREVEKKYTVIFQNEDGSEIERHDYSYGETPVCSATPTKENTAQYTYSFAWTPQIQTVQAAATYQAVFTPTTNKYTVTVKSNPSGACSITGAGLYNYNASATVALVVNDGYTFTGWSDGLEGTNTSRTITVTADKELVANFTVEEPDWTITWKSEDGVNTLATVGQKNGTATIFTGATPTEDGDAQYSYVFDGWTTEANGAGTFYKNNMTPVATANTSYYAHFKQVVNQYTVYWKNETGTLNLEVDYDQPYGAAIVYNSATPSKKADAENTYTFNGWSTTQGGTVAALPETVTGDATYYAHFMATPLVIITNLEIDVDESENLNNETVERTNLIITSNGSASGQLLGAANLTITGEAIFRLEQSMAAETWYAVAVPWAVALSGIRDNGGSAFASGDVYVIEFDANAYASADRENGRNDYWHFLDQNGHDMQPGKLYMIWFKNAQTAVEFHKKAGASLVTTSTSVALSTSGLADQSNWNAIANPALYHANMSTGAADGDILKYNGNDAYVVASSTNMVVGQPIFAQVSAASTVVATPVGGGSSAPYRRVLQETTADDRFVVELTHDGDMADRIIVQTADQKANEYVIGKDLAKMSVSTKVAQMWMERYNAKLCKNTVEMNDEYVNYPLSISAPVAGEYVLTTEQQRGDRVLYLTQNGEAIANLSDSDYTLYLNGGTIKEYGLRVGARTPQSTTGMDEAIIDAQGEIKKVLMDNQVFIIRENKVYTIDGKMVK